MLEAGLQLHLPTYSKIPLPDLLRLGEAAHGGGIGQLWVTDNLQSRNAFVVLAALASRIPTKLGTAVTVQYFRNPVDLADAVATVSELMDGRELSLGLARGNAGTPRLVRSPKPVGMLREAAGCLRRLLAGEPVVFEDYPALGSYFNFVPDRPFKLNFAPASPVPLYCGGNGPLSLAIGGELMDGILFGGTFIAMARADRLAGLLETADEAARKHGRPAPLPRVAEIKIYLSHDGQAARRFSRHSIGARILSLRDRGFTADDYRRLGIAAADVDRMDEARQHRASGDAMAELVTDSMIDGFAIAGEPSYCRDKMAEVCQLARQHGFQQLMFSELGPDATEGLDLLCKEILPVL